MRGHPGPFGQRAGWVRRRVVVVLDVLVPDDVAVADLQYHLTRCLDDVLYVAGCRGERIGSCVGPDTLLPETQPL